VNEAENRGKPNIFGKMWEKRFNNGTNMGFSIDKRWTKPHRKRRWVRFTRINTGLLTMETGLYGGHRKQASPMK
jgi:hypothetical protein